MYDTHVITRNVAKCGKCGDIIESRHRHDFVRCGCDAIFLDGGTEYIRYGGDSLADIKLLTEKRSKTREEVESIYVLPFVAILVHILEQPELNDF